MPEASENVLYYTLNTVYLTMKDLINLVLHITLSRSEIKSNEENLCHKENACDS